MLKSAGYVTGHVGKWHLGYTPQTMPNGQGFDSSFGHMGGCIDNYSHFFYWVGPNRHDLWRDGKEIFKDGEFFLDLMVDEGNKFIEANRDGPFFCIGPSTRHTIRCRAHPNGEHITKTCLRRADSTRNSYRPSTKRLVN